MTTLEAIYENGIFKPVSGVPQTIKEHERVRITIETDSESDLHQWESASHEDSPRVVSSDVLREMQAEGMISRIPEGEVAEEDDFEPVIIKGKPLSETVLEDRN